nr:MipA/OmpV family protein [Pseudoalteromonas arctica]
MVVPALSIQYGNFSLLGPQMSYKLGHWGDFEASILGKFRLDGYEADDDEFFNGMEDRDPSFDIGIDLEYDSSWGDFGLSHTADVSSTHEGYETSVSYSLPYRVSKGRIAPFISVSHLSEDLVNYYYGVKQSEVTTNRAYYQAESSLVWEIGTRSDWLFGTNHMIKADLSYRFLGSEIKDSPLIDKSGGINLIIGYVYVF